MDWTFDVSDVLQIGLILATMIGGYWKLSNRIALLEMKTADIEKDINANESKMEHKIDLLVDKIDALIIQVTRLKEKTSMRDGKD